MSSILSLYGTIMRTFLQNKRVNNEVATTMDVLPAIVWFVGNSETKD